jgi:hypothetical protein
MDWSSIGTIALLFGGPMAAFIVYNWFKVRSDVNAAKTAVESLNKVLDNSKFVDPRTQVRPLLEVIAIHQFLLPLGYITTSLRRHESWFRKVLDDHVANLRSKPVDNPIKLKDYDLYTNPMIHMISEIGLYNHLRQNYFYEMLRREQHPLIWAFALEMLSDCDEEDFFLDPEKIASIVRAWHGSNDSLKKSSIVLANFADFLGSALYDAASDTESNQNYKAVLDLSSEVLQEAQRLQSEISDDMADDFDLAVKHFEDEIKQDA